MCRQCLESHQEIDMRLLQRQHRAWEISVQCVSWLTAVIAVIIASGSTSTPLLIIDQLNKPAVCFMRTAGRRVFEGFHESLFPISFNVSVSVETPASCLRAECWPNSRFQGLMGKTCSSWTCDYRGWGTWMSDKSELCPLLAKDRRAMCACTCVCARVCVCVCELRNSILRKHLVLI